MIARRTLPLLALPPLAQAQPAWPARPVRIIQPFPPGGSPDALARILAEHLTLVFQQPFLVESRVGGGGIIGTAALAKAPPDGLTLGITNVGPLVLSPALQPMPYHPLRDFSHIAMVGEFPLALGVAAQSTITNAAELLTSGRFPAGGPHIGTPGTAGPRLILEMLRQRYGAASTIVPFRGGVAAATEVSTGRIDAVLAGLGEMQGREQIRVIGMLAPQRHPDWPDIPTLREQGFDVSLNVWFGLGAPAGLPAGLVTRLAAEVEAAMTKPTARAVAARFGAMPFRTLSPAQMAAMVAEEGARWAEVVRTGQIRPE